MVVRRGLFYKKYYWGLDPGLGKTVCAALYQNVLKKPLIFIAPPFLTRNTEDEFNKWSTHSLPIHRFDHIKSRHAPFEPAVWIVPDSMLTDPDTVAELMIYALNYKPNLIVDEAHRFKTLTAFRSQALYYDLIPWSNRVILMSGTPMPNRPIELYAPISQLRPALINHQSQHSFGVKYCEAHYNGYEWKYDGAKNLGDLKKRIRPAFMLRLTKDKVLKDLPEKSEKVVNLPFKLPKKLESLGKQLEGQPVNDLIENIIKLKTDRKVEDELPIATYRRQIGLLKARHAVEYIAGTLSESGESVLVFAHHRDVISQLEKSLKKFKPLVIQGSTPNAERHQIVNIFQTDPERKLFIGNILASGVGITLTKATKVIFVEYSWVPGENDQAADRAHRIGQKDHVIVEYLLVKDSLDEQVWATIKKKRKAIKELLT